MAPSDEYENRTIEVIQDVIIDNSIPAWEKRNLQVRSTKANRAFNDVYCNNVIYCNIQL
jgi:hypothetical protein